MGSRIEYGPSDVRPRNLSFLGVVMVLALRQRSMT